MHPYHFYSLGYILPHHVHTQPAILENRTNFIVPQLVSKAVLKAHLLIRFFPLCPFLFSLFHSGAFIQLTLAPENTSSSYYNLLNNTSDLSIQTWISVLFLEFLSSLLPQRYRFCSYSIFQSEREQEVFNLILKSLAIYKLHLFTFLVEFILNTF